MADKPSLRFADGGSLITRWARSVMRPDATADRLRQSEAPAPAPAAPPAPPPKVQDPSRVTASNPAGIRFQDGGVVPGKGKGDKIPAKYEPGEFVVSNDMIDDNPGLREELSSLRAETLARRGKTVAEADAGIVTPRGLRAMEGGQLAEAMRRAQAKTMWQPAPSNAPNLSTSPGASGGNNLIKFAVPPEPINATTSPGAAPPTPRAPSTALVPVESGARQTVDRVGPRPTLRTSPSYPVATVPGETARGGYTGSAQRPNFTMGGNPAAQSRAQAQAKEAADLSAKARAAAAERAAGRAAPTAAPPAPSAATPKAPSAASKFFGSADEWKDFFKKPADSPHKTLRPTAPGKFGKVVKGLGVVQGAVGAADAYNGLREGDNFKAAVGAADTVAAGALFTPAAPIAGTYLGLRGAWDGAKAAGSELYDSFSRDVQNTIGGTINQIGVNTGLFGDDTLMADPEAVSINEGGSPGRQRTKVSAATLPTNHRGKGYDDPRRVDMDPSRQSLGDSRDLSKELAGLPGRMPGGMREGMIYKTTDENGRTVYSGTNVREGAGFVDGRGANIGSRGSVNTVPGMSQAQIDATLTNPDGSRWSASDNAIMAANLRDGVDPYRGTSRGAAAAGGNQFQAPQNELYDGGGFGLLSNRARNERSLKMDAEQLKPGARTALKAFYEGEKEHRKNQTDVQKTAMSEDGALKRTAMTDGTTRRGQDMDLQGKRVEAQGRYAVENAKLLREAQMREAQAQIWNDAKQDPVAARDMALRYGFGDMAKSFGELATSNQSRAKAASERGVSRLESRAVDEDGNITDGAKAIVRAQANSMAPGFETMQPPEQDQYARDVLAGIDVMQGVNQTRDPSFLNMVGNAVGLAGRSDMITSLPELKGAKAEKVGFWEGATTARVGKGDMKLAMPDGTELFIPRNKVDQNTKELLRARGVIFKD